MFIFLLSSVSICCHFGLISEQHIAFCSGRTRVDENTQDACFFTGSKDGELIFARGDLVNGLSAGLERGNASLEPQGAPRTACPAELLRWREPSVSAPRPGSRQPHSWNQVYEGYRQGKAFLIVWGPCTPLRFGRMQGSFLQKNPCTHNAVHTTSGGSGDPPEDQSCYVLLSNTSLG